MARKTGKAARVEADDVVPVTSRKRPSAVEPKSMALVALTTALTAFARERNWEKFHAPKNLAMALSVEAGELLEHFQWLTESESRCLGSTKLSEVAEEVADVQIYLLMLAEKLGIDLARAVEEKIEKNRARYPADEVRGSAKKARRPEPK